jgi:prevent-host-death family protein
MRKVNLDEAQRRLPELIEEAASGEDVVISRGDGADFRLVPVVEPMAVPRQGGGLRGLLVVPDDFNDPLPDFEPYT